MKKLLLITLLSPLIISIVFFVKYQYVNSIKSQNKMPFLKEHLNKVHDALNRKLIGKDEMLGTMAYVRYFYPLKNNVNIYIPSIQLSQLEWIEVNSTGDNISYCKKDINSDIISLDIGKVLHQKKLSVSVGWSVEAYYPDKCYK
jgi:hypothetical protein